MSHDKHGPSLPEIKDEAADTPAWVPALGLGLFALITIVVAIRLAWVEANPVAVDAGAAQAAAAQHDAGVL
ncbi:MAG TPA: hypothetical protein VFG30_24565 [Polyangiales bacterium]|jgi:hypothetical protein|nr:hypothetical protein [Polyangiales bacterium]